MTIAVGVLPDGFFFEVETSFQKKSVLPASLEFAQHKLQIITFSSASNQSQGNSSFHFGLISVMYLPFLCLLVSLD